MGWKIEQTPAVRRDFDAIYDFIYQANLEFGEPVDRAEERAEQRLREVIEQLSDMLRAPFQGTLRPDIGAGVRNVTKGRALIYFRPEEETETLHVLAVFWGGQDHLARMTARRG